MKRNTSIAATLLLVSASTYAGSTDTTTRDEDYVKRHMTQMMEIDEITTKGIMNPGREDEALESLLEAAYAAYGKEGDLEESLQSLIEWNLRKLLLTADTRNTLHIEAPGTLSSKEVRELTTRSGRTLDERIHALGVWGIQDMAVLMNHVKEGCMAGAMSRTQGLRWFEENPWKCGFWSLKKEEPEQSWKITLGEAAADVLQNRVRWAR